jgi:8-oxo-dGTP pyrophosphatase MutT (NUDIX family)
VSSPGRWLDDARRVADQRRDPAREPLFASDSDEAIGSVEPVLARRLVAAGLPLRPATGGWRIDAPLDRSLATIAQWLDSHGLAAPWRDELLAVTNAAGKSIGVVERAVVRVLGIATVAVHLVGVRDDGRCWVQQRSSTKATDPGRWDTLMGGQVAAGEAIETTLARETMEEAGLALADLLDLDRGTDIDVRRSVAEGWMDERIAVFRAVVPDALTPVNRDGEVERFECLDEDALTARLAAGAFTLEATLILGAELERRDEAGRREP